MVTLAAFKNKCPLCDEIESDLPRSIALGLREKDVDNIVGETEHFKALFDISPVIHGHTLIVTKFHVCSMAQVIHQHEKELSFIINEVKKSMSESYMPPFFFEHGSNTGSQYTASCITHAHLHAIPCSIPIKKYLESYSESTTVAGPISVNELSEFREQDYLFYLDQAGRGYVCADCIKPLPHQLIRKIVAHETGREDWDWRDIFHTCRQL